MSDLGNKLIFSQNLKYYMAINNKDRNTICADLNIPYTTFAEWYNGNIYPRIDKIELIANYFHIKKSDLIERKENMNSNVISIDDVPVKVPVVGRIAAGLPILAEENIEGYEFAPSSCLKEGYSYFYLRVQGDSMNLKFNEGDIVLIQKQDTLENDEIGVILVNGNDATVKRYKKENGLVILEPISTNAENVVQIYNPKDVEIKIIGKVVSYQGKVN